MAAVMTRTFRREPQVPLQEKPVSYRQLADAYYGTLTGRALRIWSKFLPTIAHLKIDALPIEVQGELRKAAGFFDRIEIWRPDGNNWRQRAVSRLRKTATRLHSDPAAIGVITQRGKASYHPIVQWGESELMDTSQMASYLRRERVKTILFVDIPMVVLSIVALLLIGAAVLGFVEGMLWGDSSLVTLIGHGDGFGEHFFTVLGRGVLYCLGGVVFFMSIILIPDALRARLLKLADKLDKQAIAVNT